MPRHEYCVFTKPWRTLPLPELSAFVRKLGFDGVELPVRPGFQVTPEGVERGLPEAARILADHGLKIHSVAGTTEEPILAACAAVGVPLIRICVNVGPEGYLASEARLQREYDALVPLLERYGVAVGIQNHCGRCIANAMGLRSLIGRYRPEQFCAVWDAAHNALNGEEMEDAIDIVWSHLRMVNLKNAYWRRVTGPEAEAARWQPYWTLGRHGLASWARVAAELTRRGWQGPLCLPAEYTDEHAVNRLIAEDVRYAKSLFGDA